MSNDPMDEIVTGEAHYLLTAIQSAMEDHCLEAIVGLLHPLAVVDPISAQMVWDIVSAGMPA